MHEGTATSVNVLAAVQENTRAVDHLRTAMINVCNNSTISEDVADVQEHMGTMAVSIGQLVKVVEEKLSSLLVGIANLQLATSEGLGTLVGEIRQLDVAGGESASQQLATEAADAMEL